MIRKLSLLLLSITGLVVLAMPLLASGEKGLRIARWYQDHEGAVTLRFDDGDDSHITTVIPLLSKYDIKATFMVNPGKRQYREHKDVWERKVPSLGHRLGNHTMNHRGARSITEAEYEIGEAAQVIQRVYAGETKLMVFASGGGEKWGGADWEQASPEYRDLVAQYHLIDLYDGKFTSHLIKGSSTVEELCSLVVSAASQEKHQPFHAHRVGTPTLMDRIKTLARGSDLVIPTETLEGMLACLSGVRDRVWVAPLIDVLKYEEEVGAASLERGLTEKENTTWNMKVTTDPALYDHPLTLILPVEKKGKIVGVMQDRTHRDIYEGARGQLLVDVAPVDSAIILQRQVN